MKSIEGELYLHRLLVLTGANLSLINQEVCFDCILFVMVNRQLTVNHAQATAPIIDC